MNFLQSYGLSIPRFHIEHHILQPKLGKKSEKRAIIFTDEDPITLAFDAANKCLANFSEKDQPHKDIDAVLFATTTPVFRNRYHASFLAELLDLRKGLLALDFCSSPRAGTDAFILADQLLAAGKYKRVLLVAADTYFPSIGEELVPSSRSGHAGCALLLGKEDGFASIEKAHSYSSFIAEKFTYKENKIQLDPRFSRNAGFKTNIKFALDDFLRKSTTKAENFDAVILHSLFAGTAVGTFAKSGFNPKTQFFMDTISGQIGFTGTCHALLLLLDSLEKNSGQVLLFDYHNGTNILSMKLTETIDTSGDNLSKQLSTGDKLTSYQDYLKLRQAGNLSSSSAPKQEMFSSEMMLEREKKSLLYLQGFECAKCGSVFFLKAQRCKQCKGEEFSLKKLSGRGKIFSFTREHYFPSSFSPVTMAVIDLEGGGRLTLQVTDEIESSNLQKELIGAEVTLVLRKMMENETKPNYFWKCKLDQSTLR